MIAAPWLNFAIAVGVGLMIGLERERSKGVGVTRRPAGIRTFTLAALMGAVSNHLGGVPLLAVATASVMALAALSYLRSPEDDPGLTTEIGLIATPLLGGLAMSDTGLAAGLGAAVAVILAAKAPLHGFVTRVLTGAEVTDGLVFAVATLVIWPQLPDRYLGPFEALNPHSVWLRVSGVTEMRCIALQRRCSSSDAVADLLQFTTRLRGFAPFNAMLLHIQKPGLTCAATTADWFRRFGRVPKKGARPLVV